MSPRAWETSDYPFREKIECCFQDSTGCGGYWIQKFCITGVFTSKGTFSFNHDGTEQLLIRTHPPDGFHDQDDIRRWRKSDAWAHHKTALRLKGWRRTSFGNTAGDTE